MVALAAFFLIFNASGVMMFMSFFFEYYIARHDLSEAQVRSVLAKLPEFLQPPFLMRSGTVEMLVKKASMPFPLGMMVLTLLLPIATIGNIFIEWDNNRPLLSIIYVLILLGSAYAVWRFYQLLQNPDEM